MLTRRCYRCKEHRELRDFDLSRSPRRAVCLRCRGPIEDPPPPPPEKSLEEQPRSRAAVAAASDFDEQTVAQLAARGILFVGLGWLKDDDGKFTRRGYLLDDNGDRRARDHAGVIALACEPVVN